MTREFKGWLYKLANGKTCKDEITKVHLEGLIKAMWAINRNNSFEYIILMDTKGINAISPKIKNRWGIKEFSFKHHNNSEQKALTKALEFIHWYSTNNELPNP